MTSFSLEGSCADNIELQLAQSVKYSSALIWGFGEIRPGLFVLYNHEAVPVYIGDDWNELLAIYQSRPRYIQRVYTITKIPGLDLAKLEISI